MAKFQLSFESNEDDTENYETDQVIEKEEVPVDLPVAGELNVDEVYKQEHDPKEVLDAVNSVDTSEEDVRQEAVAEAVEATTELTAVAEALISAINKDGSFDSTAARLAMLSLEANRKKVGFQNKSIAFSLENHSDNVKLSSKLALEGIMNTLKHIWDVICKTISRSIAWVSNFFKQLIFGVKNDINFIRSTTNELLENRKNNLEKIKKETSFGFDKENFVSDSALCLKLTTGNKPVANYKEEFTDILYLLNPSKCKSAFGKNPFEETFNDEFINELKEYLTSELKEGKTSKNKISFIFENFLTNYSNKSTKLDGAPTLSENGIAAQENHFYLKQYPLLGGFTLIHEINQNAVSASSKSNIEVLQNISTWNIQAQPIQAAATNKGWLRFLDNLEIEETTEVVMQILTEVENFDRNIQQLTKFQNNLNKIATEARQYSFDTQTADGQNRIAIANVTIAAMSKIVNVLNRTTFEYVKYARQECNAWGLYLNLILQKEKQLVSK